MSGSSFKRIRVSVLVILCFLPAIILGQSNTTCTNGSSQPVPTLTLAYGRGIVGGITDSPITFHIQLVDSNGNYVTTGGYSVSAAITGPSSNPKSQGYLSKDNQDGTYSFSYEVSEEGQYSIIVLLNGQPILGSPFKPYFLSSSQCPLKFNTLSGPYLSEVYSHVSLILSLYII
jgi:hypothetical protein